MAVKTVLCFCTFLVISSIVTARSEKKYPISFEDALLHPFSPETFNGTWISSNEYIYEDDSTLYKTNVETDETTVLLNRTLIEKFNLTDVLVSADGKWVAIEHDKQSIFRHSRTSLYTIINLETEEQYVLAEGRRIQLIAWAPVGSGLVFVAENDIYYQSEEDRLVNTTHRITTSNKDIFNGVADWVYEEEVLGDTKALWFSPDGSKLVFATMNDVNVRNVTFWKYGDPNRWTNKNLVSSQYVQEVVIKYPKVGTRNPVAYLNYVDLASENFKPVIFKAPTDLVTSDNILGAVSWANNTHFSVTWMERLQTKACTQLCSADVDSACDVVYSYHEDNGWLDIVEPVWVNSTAFLTVLPHDQGGQLGNYRQLSLVQDGQDVPLTSGPSVVTAIRCYDKEDNTVYYSSTVNGDSAKRHVYKMDLNNPEKQECFSCLVQEDCAYGTASFSKSCTNMLLTCRGPSVPQYHIYNKNGTLLKYLSNNSRLSELLTRVELPTKQDLTVPIGGGFTGRVRMLLPPNIDTSGRTKYPMLFSVYAGPDFNKISDAWAVPGWDDYLVTKRRVVLVYLDVRGSGLRGDKLKFAVYHKLGGPEIEDIINVAQYLQQKFPYIDAVRTAIWGWSYGGFATAMTLAKDRLNVFRCGISVAPVTNWIYYDTVYTERYMGLPTNDSNLAGYMASDVSAHVDNFRHKLFYLIHGNADDNVHYQQSMMLSRALELADILFFQQSYPDETHGLSHVHRHLYHSMDKFWTRCFHLNSSDYLDPGLALDLSVDYSDTYSE
ncbi:venom dipeptidyl peptidase 4-like isoform X2 [Homalodisca vitripennis]|uniref:venom dipeptidyl peptidase 4-like isoform X2 n=1 Tax=Homalodisca vitripennis TaxID=197043 RepID=UPI001EEA344D|nr:venom dipeptidyl peptidase 4-like isoform X2 [Homalodisca vitripennis]